MIKNLLVNVSLWGSTLGLCFLLGSMFFSSRNSPLVGESKVSESQLVSERYLSPTKHLVELLDGMGVQFKQTDSLLSRLQKLDELGLVAESSLEEFSSDGNFLGLLEYPGSGYAIVGGLHRFGDGPGYFQLVRSGAGTDLVTKETMIRDGAESLWVMKKMPISRSASGSLSIAFDTPWINLGVDDGSDESRSAFVKDEKTGQFIKSNKLAIKNEGSELVYLDKTVSSCGCLVVGDKSRIKIDPGKSHVVDLKANLGGKAKYAHNVVFQFSNEKNEKLATIYEVFGNRLLGHKSVLVNSAYLGEISLNRTRDFKFSMFESIEDRFEFLSVEINGDNFFEYEVKTNIMPNGLNRYDFTLMPHRFDALKGVYGRSVPLVSVMNIKTTSANQNQIGLDVSGVLVVEDDHQPKLVALGQVHRNVSQSVVVPGAPIGNYSISEVRLKKEFQNENIDVAVADQSEYPNGIFVTFKKLGIVEVPVTCVFESETGGTDEVEVLLSAYVKTESK